MHFHTYDVTDKWDPTATLINEELSDSPKKKATASILYQTSNIPIRTRFLSKFYNTMIAQAQRPLLEIEQNR